LLLGYSAYNKQRVVFVRFLALELEHIEWALSSLSDRVRPVRRKAAIVMQTSRIVYDPKNQRRRFAVRAKGLGCSLLKKIATLVTPARLLAWRPKLVAQWHDGCTRRARQHDS
jgi:hypothetical protein